KQSELVSHVFFWLNRPSAPLRGSIASQKKMRSVQRSIEKTGEPPNLFLDRGSRTKRPFPNEKASSSQTAFWFGGLPQNPLSRRDQVRITM
ncbi:hypothetical protein C1T08_26395, partial [Vibrio parahaemolyticus]